MPSSVQQTCVKKTQNPTFDDLRFLGPREGEAEEEEVEEEGGGGGGRGGGGGDEGQADGFWMLHHPLN